MSALQSRRKKLLQLNSTLNNQYGEFLSAAPEEENTYSMSGCILTEKSTKHRDAPVKKYSRCMSRNEKARKAELLAQNWHFTNFQDQFASGQVKPYEIKKLYMMENIIGRGSFGKIRRAKEKLTSHVVAIKSYSQSELDAAYPLCSSSFEAQKQYKKNALNEIRCMSVLDHSNIVRFFESITTPSSVHIVMEYANQGTLAQVIKKTSFLSMGKIKIWLKELGNAIMYLHSMNIIHRDLKPSNVFLKNGQIKLGDFGLAKKLRNGEKQNSFCGTLQYMAPEIILGYSEYDGRAADMWSLGVLLFELVFKTLPFTGNSEMQLRACYQRVVQVKLPAKEVDERVKKILISLLSINPDNRMSALDLCIYLNPKCENSKSDKNNCINENILNQVSLLTKISHEKVLEDCRSKKNTHILALYKMLEAK